MLNNDYYSYNSKETVICTLIKQSVLEHRLSFELNRLLTNVTFSITVRGLIAEFEKP